MKMMRMEKKFFLGKKTKENNSFNKSGGIPLHRGQNHLKLNMASKINKNARAHPKPNLIG